MPSELKRSRPQDWFRPFRHCENAKLTPDETLAMVLHFEIEKRGEPIQIIFTVIRKGNKAIAKSIMSHEDNAGFCEGHSDDIAEYPIENEKDLIEEVRSHGLMMGLMLANDINDDIKMNTQRPAFYLQTPTNATNAGVIAKFAESNDPLGEKAKKVITDVLGLSQTNHPGLKSLNESLFPTAKSLTKEENEKTKGVNNLEKAAKEMELIKKFGKKPILDLAKKMGYHGITINKETKNKSHAN